MKKEVTIDNLPIDSTKLCCNFVNTRFAWKGEDQHDLILNYDVFIDWCVKLSVHDTSYLNRLRLLAKEDPDRATRAMKKLVRLRLLLHGFISSIATGHRHKSNALLAALNPAIANALAHVKLEHAKGVWSSGFQIQPPDLLSPSWVILKSLYDMLTTLDPDRIKECPSCGWVFYDETKNGKRRWCNPLNCGTKDKMDRYTQKLKERED